MALDTRFLAGMTELVFKVEQLVPDLSGMSFNLLDGNRHLPFHRSMSKSINHQPIAQQYQAGKTPVDK
jgi:hypothetical protein